MTFAGVWAAANASSRDPLPLEGIRILDLTRALAGPFCTTLLGDLGADVLKVEPLTGDLIRQWGPFDRDTSLYHVAVNRNKRSVALDLRSSAGKEVLRRMVLQSDVVVENFRPGVLDALGLDAEWLRTNAADVVVASATGFGSHGPLHLEPCFDQIAQGMGGLMSVTGEPAGEEVRVGLPIVDILTGMFTAIGVASSLLGRERGKSTRRIETSMLESVAATLTFHAQGYLSTGQLPQRTGNAHPVIEPYGTYDTADRPINIAAATQPQFERLCACLGRPELATDERFVDGKARMRHRTELAAELSARLATAGSEQWIERLRGASIPVGPVYDMAGLFADPQIRALGIVETVEHPDLGLVRMLRGPLRIDNAPTPIHQVPPRLGEHGVDILREVGLTEQEITELIDSGVLLDEHRAAPAAASRM